MLDSATSAKWPLFRGGELRAQVAGAEAQVEAVASARRALELGRVLYDQGLDDFLTVLDAERTLRALEDRLAISEIAVSLQVAIYKALGAGWMLLDEALEEG